MSAVLWTWTLVWFLHTIVMQMTIAIVQVWIFYWLWPIIQTHVATLYLKHILFQIHDTRPQKTILYMHVEYMYLTFDSFAMARDSWCLPT